MFGDSSTVRSPFVNLQSCERGCSRSPDWTAVANFSPQLVDTCYLARQLVLGAKIMFK